MSITAKYDVSFLYVKVVRRMELVLGLEISSSGTYRVL